MSEQQDARIMVSSDLTASTVPEYIEALGITDDQIVNITEPEKGKFSVIFRSTAEQRQAHEEWLAERAERFKKVAAETYGVHSGSGFRPFFTTARPARRR